MMQAAEQRSRFNQDWLDGAGDHRLAFIEADEIGEPRNEGTLNAMAIGMTADSFDLPEEASEVGIRRVSVEILETGPKKLELDAGFGRRAGREELREWIEGLHLIDCLRKCSGGEPAPAVVEVLQFEELILWRERNGGKADLTIEDFSDRPLP